MAISVINNLSMNRSDAAVADDVWTATSATASDFQAAAAGGKILQYIAISDDTEYGTNTGTTPTAVQGTAADLVITPVAATSRILVSYYWGAISSYIGSNLGYGKIMYDIGGAGYNDVLPVGTNAAGSIMQFSVTLQTSDYQAENITCAFIHHPNTASEVTYKPYFFTDGATGYTFINRVERNVSTDPSTVMFAYALEIGA